MTEAHITDIKHDQTVNSSWLRFLATQLYDASLSCNREVAGSIPDISTVLCSNVLLEKHFRALIWPFELMHCVSSTIATSKQV